MRRIFTSLAMTALAAVIPTLVLAGNQEVADQIAQRLRGSGEVSDYKISIKCQDGTAWLRGRVANEEQMNRALKVVFQTPGVTRVVNELTLAPATPEKAAEPVAQMAPETPVAQDAAMESNPLREQMAQTARSPQRDGLVKRLESVFSRNSGQDSGKAERVSSSYRSAPVETVSAQEVQEEVPQQMSDPQRARPMGNRMAMQSTVRGPVAANGAPLPMYTAAASRANVAPARYDQPCMPNYAWPSYAAYPNYAAVSYPKQYSPTAWPYIGPFYPYPQVPMGWRKVTLEWDDGWWFLDFKDQPASCWHR